MGAGFPPGVVAAIIIAAVVFQLGRETWHGLKWVGRHVKSAAHHIVHPHEQQEAPDAQRFTRPASPDGGR